MNKSFYGLRLLVSLTLILPAIAMAESENEENEYGETEGSENGIEDNVVIGNNTSNIILYITLTAIAGVGGYSTYKVYKAKKRSTKKMV